MSKINPDRIFEGKTVREWAIETGFRMSTITNRIDRGLPLAGVRCSTASAQAKQAKQTSTWNSKPFHFGKRFRKAARGEST
jgi:hypothetical protein